MSSIGERITRLREELGLSRPRLAREADVSYSFLVQVETGQRENPQVDKLANVARVLGVSVDVLLDLDAPLPSPLNESVRDLRKYLIATINSLGENELIQVSELISVLVQQSGIDSSKIRTLRPDSAIS